MTILVILAIGLLVPAAAAVLAQRRSLATRLADIRGVALQTVIVIVVMLVIAGAVAGVLLTRGGEVVSDLENQDVGPVTEANCPLLQVGGETGTVVTAVTTLTEANLGIELGAGKKACFWTGANVSLASCVTIGGGYRAATTTGVTASSTSGQPGIAANEGACSIAT